MSKSLEEISFSAMATDIKVISESASMWSVLKCF